MAASTNPQNPNNPELRSSQDQADNQERFGAANPVYQELILRYLATGEHDTFAASDPKRNSLDSQRRENILQGIANGNFDAAIQSMLANDMVSKGTMTTEQMRQVCASQIEYLKQAGRESIVAHRFVDTVRQVHEILSPLLQEDPATPATKPKLAPLPTSTDSTEKQLDPELASKQQLQHFLETRLQALQVRLQRSPNISTADQYQLTSRINLIQRLSPAIAEGRQLSSQDSRLLLFLIDEVKRNKPDMVALSQAQVANNQTREVPAATQPESVAKAA